MGWLGADADQLMIQLMHRDLARRKMLPGLVWFRCCELAGRNIQLGLVWFRC